MSTISFVRVDTQEVIGTAPMADWWRVAGELCAPLMRMNRLADRDKLMALLSLGDDCRKPPRRVVMSELDLVDWNFVCSFVMIRLLEQVGRDSQAFLDFKGNEDIELSKFWSFKTSTVFVELLALNMVLIEANCAVEAREIRTPMLKVV